MGSRRDQNHPLNLQDLGLRCAVCPEPSNFSLLDIVFTTQDVGFSPSYSALTFLVVYFFSPAVVINSGMGVGPQPFH